MGKPLFRKTKDGRIFEWKVEKDAPLCTLQEVFEEFDRSIGFNIELKFDDQMVYTEEELTRVLEVILKVFFLAFAFSFYAGNIIVSILTCLNMLNFMKH